MPVKATGYDSYDFHTLQAIQGALINFGWGHHHSGMVHLHQKTELCHKDKSVHSKQLCINILQMFPLRGQVEPDRASKAHPTAYQSCQSPH